MGLKLWGGGEFLGKGAYKCQFIVCVNHINVQFYFKTKIIFPFVNLECIKVSSSSRGLPRGHQAASGISVIIRMFFYL